MTEDSGATGSAPRIEPVPTPTTNPATPTTTPAPTSTSSTPTPTPTLQTAADARLAVNADPTINQVRTRTEAALPSGFPEDGTVEDARQFLEANPPQGDDPSTWTPDQLRAFNVLGHDFGARHADHHEQWHLENGPGGTRGPGSGELFLAFHRGMMNDFERETGVAAPRGWDPSSPVPSELTDPLGARTNTNANVFTPNWLTTDGNGSTIGNEDFGETVTIDGQTFTRLGDFENPDQLGRALGESGYHASAHVNLGGTMSGFQSPRDSAFYLWHGHIDGIIDQWLQTENGQAWAAANPDNPLLDPNLSAAPQHAGH